MVPGATIVTASVLRGLVALAGAAVLCLSGAAEARVLLTLDDFGAVGDGVANDTQAFVDAWTAACGSEEEAVVAVPAAKAYQIWPVQLSGPCKKKLKLLIAGTIVAPASPDEWAGRDPMKWLYVYGVDGLSVSGGGTIDGVGHEWWARSCKRKNTQAVHFEECRGVSVQGVTLQNGPQFHLSFTRCVDVKANFLRVVAPADSPNTDGIHLNDSSRVQIMDNLISTGDDCVSMVGNCSDVRVRDISCGPGHGISIGSLGKNRTTDRVENVRVDTCLLTNTTNGVRIKSWQGGTGSARDLRFEGIVMKNVSNPIIIDQYYCDQPTPCANQTEAVEVRKVEFVDVRGTSATAQAIRIACSDAVPCTELELRNVNLTVVGGGAATASCYRASGKAAGVVVPWSCLAKGDP
ncbi:probable polygalacturonase At1g80170 isoform X2 [Hordeum vulgare subsp. vulgare]|uniref:probable polygalacturonase At1g80170 isoform X2 n=1 Tax=Hordeum vulgare subsp. vulgare TaxID=112509 RepID=UPI001D1A3B4F|nr:probable polygalacturonase At1g80170 isoform X2 [Hordeum vulgare subsp. vulgare]